MQLQTFGITFSIAFLWLSGISEAAQSPDPLSVVPADPQQTEQPQWANAVPPYPLTLFSKAEVDLNSVKKRDNGQIAAWTRDTYEETQQPSTDHAFQIGETHYLIDCNDGQYTTLSVNNRRANGDIVKSVQMPNFIRENLTDVPPNSLISAKVTLACVQAKKNWPSEQHYDLVNKPKHIPVNIPLTSQEKEKIDRAIVQQKQADKRNIPFAEPPLTTQNGKSICQSMNGTDGNPSSYELCHAEALFAHDIYSVRVNGIPFLQGIDDDATRGIEGVLNGSPIRLQCEPVNQLADGVTNKTIESAILSNRVPSKAIPFDEELEFAVMTNVIEIGRHCTLSNTEGVIATLDVVSP